MFKEYVIPQNETRSVNIFGDRRLRLSNDSNSNSDCLVTKFNNKERV